MIVKEHLFFLYPPACPAMLSLDWIHHFMTKYGQIFTLYAYVWCSYGVAGMLTC